VVGGERVSLRFRCTDEAHQRLFRRSRGGTHLTNGERFDEVLRRFCAEVEPVHEIGVTLTHPKSEVGKVRRVWVDPEIKKRFEAIVAKTPVSAEMLIREAIYRFTKVT
jgi:hypothetical protein